MKRDIRDRKHLTIILKISSCLQDLDTEKERIKMMI